jgi:uncharacterized damage-inducible protein DinB
MPTPPDPKSTLVQYLREARESLLWKLDGLSERDLRLPRTATGTNLLGLVKHVTNVEAGFFGLVAEEPYPHPGDLVALTDEQTDPLEDMYATAQESAQEVVARYRRVQTFVDETIEQVPLEATAQVPWWPRSRRTITLHRILVHVTAEISRHAGHADILREGIDGAIGLRRENSNLPEGEDWPDYRERLVRIAESF